jgi:hypothetical protein
MKNILIEKYTITYFVIKSDKGYICNILDDGLYLIDVKDHKRASRFSSAEDARTEMTEWAETTGNDDYNHLKVIKVTSKCTDEQEEIDGD